MKQIKNKSYNSSTYSDYLRKDINNNYDNIIRILIICMISILLSCILLINFSFALDMANLNNNIKGWYELNDSIYSDATDSTGNLNLTIITSSGFLINTDGIYNSAKTGFNGIWDIAYGQAGYMSQSHLINMSYDGTYTIHYVFRTDNFSSRTDENYFLGDLGEGNCGTFGIRILFNPYTNITSSYAMSQCNFIGGVVSYYTPQTDWIFLTVVYNSTNLKMYINDILVNETGVSGLESTTPSDYITLGGFNYQTGFQSSESGLYNNLVIDTFGYWNYEMSLELISYLYNLGNGITYPFNIEPTINIISPANNSVNTDFVYINYSSFDYDNDSLYYKIYINDILKIDKLTNTFYNYSDINMVSGYYKLTVFVFENETIELYNSSDTVYFNYIKSEIPQPNINYTNINILVDDNSFLGSYKIVIFIMIVLYIIMLWFSVSILDKTVLILTALYGILFGLFLIRKYPEWNIIILIFLCFNCFLLIKSFKNK